MYSYNFVLKVETELLGFIYVGMAFHESYSKHHPTLLRKPDHSCLILSYHTTDNYGDDCKPTLLYRPEQMFYNGQVLVQPYTTPSTWPW